jgi:hypothetical protein
MTSPLNRESPSSREIKSCRSPYLPADRALSQWWRTAIGPDDGYAPGRGRSGFSEAEAPDAATGRRDVRGRQRGYNGLMSIRSPRPLTPAERRARRSQVARLARKLGFVGRVEYQHVYSQTGGAQYGRGSTAVEDLLTVYAEAFERDADPEDFSLKAILAHERGYQLLARHPRIAKRVAAARISAGSEEILASLLGAMHCAAEADRDALVAKATVELLNHGEALEVSTRRLQELWDLLEALL